MNSGGHIPLLAKECCRSPAGITCVRQFCNSLCKGGVDAPSKNAPVPKRRGRGGSLASDVSECVLKHLRLSDHPVCGASVASRLFINAAATPPLQGGECPAAMPD